MLPSYFLKINIVIANFLVLIFSSSASSYEVLARDFKNKMIPTFIQSIRVSGDIVFCNIKIPLENENIRQRFEKEFLIAHWDRP
jgi:hypothetical protein